MECNIVNYSGVHNKQPITSKVDGAGAKPATWPVPQTLQFLTCMPQAPLFCLQTHSLNIRTATFLAMSNIKEHPAYLHVKIGDQVMAAVVVDWWW
ncbi:hypothetical protein E2C01_010527 [Portunus trituberculatus]|uniref:Uncharacterized protein n=1 Tax=Portunus trituberculatus TaxID=210409 RepID=A0A5B7D8W6_PORTR|nr:hypothetical protein [Portunus trituberculatus]